MNERCESPIAWAELVDYAAGDLASTDADRIEEHLMGCAGCTDAAERVLSLTNAVAALPEPVISREELARLRARGLRIAENRLSPSERRSVTFGPDVDLLIHRLAGLDLSASTNVAVAVRIEATNEVLANIENAPFDREAGEVLIACQRHFSVFPPDVVFEVRVRDQSGGEQVARYAVPHEFVPD